MNEPTRWRDDPEAPSEMRELLGHARPSRRMTAEQFARGAGRVSAATAAAGGVLFWLKGVAWATLIGAGSGLLFVGGAAKLRGEEAVVEPMRGSLGAVTPHLDRHAAPPEKAPETAPAEAPESAPSAQKPVSSRDSLAEEAELIERARALVASNPNGALVLLDQHQARFARGKLGMERELLRVDALRRAGRTAEAKSRVQALLARNKNSIYETRLRQLETALGGSATK